MQKNSDLQRNKNDSLSITCKLTFKLIDLGTCRLSGWELANQQNLSILTNLCLRSKLVQINVHQVVSVRTAKLVKNESTYL